MNSKSARTKFAKLFFAGFATSVAMASALCAQPAPAPAPAAIYLDPSQPLEKRVEDLISKMTLQEKALELFHNAPGIERLHVPMWGGWNQCLHGVNSKQPTTLFPTSIAAAATWDPDLIHAEANALSDEGRALYNTHATGPRGPQGLVYRAPVINISRDPRWGRIQECYGEDPYLTSRIGVAYVKGLQGDDPKYLKVASTLKHFAVNNQERGRQSLSAAVPERILYEYFLPHFKACVVEGHAQSLMASYNAINGTPNAVNKLLLTDILRGQWGFEGFVVSDLGGVKALMTGHHLTDKPEIAAARAILAGCDYDDEEYRDNIVPAVKDGLITEKDVDLALLRVLRVAFRLGAFDPPEMVPYSDIAGGVINSQEHRDLSRQVASSSIVLLTNKNNFLPLSKSKLKTVAVIGPEAETPEYGNYFNYNTPLLKVTPLQGLKDRLGPGVEVISATGCAVVGAAEPGKIDEAAQAAKRADVAILFLGTSLRVEAESRDRSDLNLPGAQEQLLEAVYKANPKTVVVLMNGGPLSTPWARDNVPAMLDAFYAGEEGGHAIADVLLGDANPSGKLPYTVYESVDQIPPMTEYDITKGFTYMYFAGKPGFAFGHGLSYTQFTYSNLRLAAAQIPGDGTLTVTIDVQNSGPRGGAEVIQLYTHQQQCSVKQPIQKLVGFQKVQLAPGQTRSVSLSAPAEQFAIYDEQSKNFVIEPGKFDAMIGSSSADIRARQEFDVTSKGIFKP
jgi:beta-glucosidase